MIALNEPAQRLLAAIERFPTSLRDGTDSLAVLYWWRKQGGDSPQFAEAMQALMNQGLVTVVPGPDLHLRLSDSGFAALESQWAVDPPAEVEAEATQADESAWRGGAAPAQEAPVERLVGNVLDIFAVLQRPAGLPLAAATLSKIWAMESRRGGDLRTALDTLATRGDLSIQRGQRTTFTLTEQGARRAGMAR
jgi:hypothetical protein